ncbi:putative monovalent cation/H+ antiporter subunit G [Pseudomonas coronafaciens pv. atropurpurea]|uniref:Na+/H+ antiporter subunit G n=1 Tax=Pseudomonas coronafaciens TaxID=53409 RepID=UPI0006D61B97|nr:Na+/H+ antiporter subunit G [Pseudomonas coronafaciens]KPW39753.1 putative monovalent cation/H+ antiporter subunit G [Pseudomonas coronafaciens pv. atropurpurea]RMT60378.1 putative monovalent cation/H+ antiporter subunit G [Pseudomonas coronafaciens pv. atropurpurea]
MTGLPNTVSFWAEILTAGLLIASSLFALTGALGLLRLKDFFQRMHPPALASTLGAWCVALASIIYFSALKSEPVIHAWLIPVLLAITVPVTTLLLARTALFRKRMAGDDVPAEVSSGLADGESSGG